VGGGIPALANLTTPAEIFDRAYHRNPSTENPEAVEPTPHHTTMWGEVDIPTFYPAVLRLRDLVPVDYEIPGCPPQADRVWESIQAVVSGAVPPRNAAVRVGCGEKPVCDEGPLEKRLVKVKRFVRHHQVRPEPGWCLLEQGLLCMGPATRSGCTALCLKAGMRCEGCYGAPMNAEDQAASIIGALGPLLEASDEAHARELVAEIADLAGSFYRFSLASGYFKVAK
jgi:F420-non-reducing hydrogenase small subunit